MNVSSLAPSPIKSLGQSVSQCQDFDVTVRGWEVEKRFRPTFTPLSAVRPRSVKTHREAGGGNKVQTDFSGEGGSEGGGTDGSWGAECSGSGI